MMSEWQIAQAFIRTRISPGPGSASVTVSMVIGAPNSSNSRRLVEVGRAAGCGYAQLVPRATDIDWRALGQIGAVGVTAGASAPEVLVREVLDGLRALGASAPVELAGRPENVTFSLPRELRIEVKNL